ncbi:MAG: 4-hydroxybenzoate polyprenyltransferase, partial [Nonomuraea sp.]|nr:4-hydroxybenzoate polyprenyltransferase [Nonomuraea sp.]
GWYAAQFGLPQARAVADPSARRVRDAVGAGIVSLPALQGALAARGGAPRLGLALAAVVPLARRLVRKISAT